MRGRPPAFDTAIAAAQIAASWEIDRVRALGPSFAAASPETVAAILDEASRFAETWLVPLNDVVDAQGCRLVEGRVHTAPGHRAAWDAFVAAGWTTLAHPETWGGQGLPLALGMAVQAIFDRACPAFGMMAVSQSAAAKLIAAHAEPTIRAEWLPRLVSGKWGATICISEAGAGSDVARVSTRATPKADGSWSITGEKCWISFGDHDLTARIGHCVLARTPGAAPSAAGLSLFLVPDVIDGARNGVTVRRIEEKMGLHGSPTCALGFDDASGRLIGIEGRGLAQMFVMIAMMRLSVGAQGLGIASSAADIAGAYARERRQGGGADATMTIADHPDIQRQLLTSFTHVETLRGLLLAAANQADLAAYDPDPERRADAQALVGWLLPIVKTRGGEIAFAVADTAMQVMGAAGYTREWPVEQALRDARVLTIYEGTTGIQALDLVMRRLIPGDARGYRLFLLAARREVCDAPAAARCLDRLEEAADRLRAGDARSATTGATAFLHLAALAAEGWMAVRLARTALGQGRLANARRCWLVDGAARAALLMAQVACGDP